METLVWLTMYIISGIILNTMIDLEFVEPSGDWPRMDAFLTLLLFKILWPAGLIVFVVLYYRGRGSIS